MFRYEPSKLIKKIAPAKTIKKMVSDDVTLKRATLSFVSKIDFLDKKAIVDVALKTLKSYRERIKADSDIKGDLTDDPAQLIQRVQNEIVFQVKEEIKDAYLGEPYVWLPSDADEPDPEHQLNYGKTFIIGDGEMPGDRIGCRCGMEILTKDKSLNLEGG